MQLRSNINELFYQSFDPARIEGFLQKILKKSEQERRRSDCFQGEGTHFQSFHLASKPINLAINVAKSNFLQQSPKGFERWATAIRALRHVETQDLIPPLEIIHFETLTAIVMPHGTPLPRKGAAARELSDLLQETSRSLGKMGLTLDDYPQLVECAGKVFICDWSDLQRAS